MSTQHRRARVVVVGGGFAGRAAVQELRRADVDVLLLDRASYATFEPLLHQVATAGLNSGDITLGLRTFTSRSPNARFRLNGHRPRHGQRSSAAAKMQGFVLIGECRESGGRQ